MAEHRKLTKKEKWAIGGGAAAVVAVVGAVLYERHKNANAAPQPLPPGPSAPTGGSSGDTNTSNTVNTTNQNTTTQGADIPTDPGFEEGDN